MFTQEQQHHHLQILGHHPASPAGCSFLDLPADAFTRGSSSSGSSSTSSSTSNNNNTTSYSHDYETDANGYTSPAAEDCQASADYMYSQMHSSQFSNDQFAAMAPSYMMSMARSFSDSQLSEICSPTLQGTTAVKMELCDSPSLYHSNGMFEDDYHYSNSHNSHSHSSNHNLYSTQYHSNSRNSHHHHHHSHSYSTSSLSTLSSSSDDSSMSPRSTFSTGSLSLSSSSNSRTLSEPSIMPIFQTMSTSSSMSDLSSLNNSNCSDDSKQPMITLVGPIPKRSRGRRVSSHPDNSGCKIFKCRFEDCGKIFKRSEHLKRHVRSIHTLEKPFECPINNCPKRFSRSDNLNQHIRIHRHTSGARAAEKHSKAMASFTPFLDTYSTGLLTL
ncbi:hypothetical protein BGX23_006186 [Mortierella sp. AD031]|nr:hypothetical protein BGX23_006186 [Mortierella sp. AD031]KAG0207693.1 hypothetical protein BGX33_006678 [Mortierella sp. NVP41]